MDAFTAANALATIVQLIGVYRQESGAAAALDHQSFGEWLQLHRLQEIKDLISNTHHLQTEVDALLKLDHDLMLKKLDSIDASLATLMSRVDVFRPLAMKMVPSAELSEQAISILRQFVSSGGKKMSRLYHYGGIDFSIQGHGAVSYTEPRFLDDDLKLLVELNYLSFSKSTNAPMEWYGIPAITGLLTLLYKSLKC